MFGQRLRNEVFGANKLVKFPEDIFAPQGKDETKKDQPQKILIEPDSSGSFNQVFYRTLPGVFVKTYDNKEEIEAKVAYSFSDLTNEDRSLNHQRFLAAQILLLQKKVPDHFNHSLLYFDSLGRKISLQGIDFHTYRRAFKNQLKDSVIITFATDIILAVYDLHARGLVHRDIKSENFLLFQDDKHYSLKLIDHDGVREVDKQNHLIGFIDASGTPDCYPPEMKTSPDPTGKDLKAVDLFSLGILLIEDLGYAAQSSLMKKNLVNAFKHLMSIDPKARGTVEKLFESTLFGETPEARKKHFADRREKVRQQNVKIDGYAFDPVNVNDPFYVLDRRIKPIYQQGLILAHAINEMEAMPEPEKGMPKVRENLATLRKMPSSDEYKMYVVSLKAAAEQDAAEIETAMLLRKTLDTALTKFKSAHLLPSPTQFAECKTTPALAVAEKLRTDARKTTQPEKLIREFFASELKATAPSKFIDHLRNELFFLDEDLLKKLELLQYVKPAVFASKQLLAS